MRRGGAHDTVTPMKGSLRGSRILVTGGGGFIGSHLVRRLVREHAHVAVVSTEKDPWRLRDVLGRVEYHAVSILARPLPRIVGAFRPDVVFHLAALIPARKPTAGEQKKSIVTATRLLAHTLEQAGTVQRLITLGAADEYGKASCPKETSVSPALTAYGRAKRAASDFLESAAKKSSFSTIVLRPPICYGPAQDFGMFVPDCARAILGGKEFTVWGEDLSRDFIYVEDLVEATLCAATATTRKKYAAYNIGSGRGVKLTRVARMLARPLGREDLILSVHARRSNHEPRSRCLDIGKALRELDWRPGTSLETGLQKTLRWYKANRTRFSYMERT